MEKSYIVVKFGPVLVHKEFLDFYWFHDILCPC